MKRAVFLLFVILSFYIAGLYRYPPLLVLSTAALLSLPLLFALPRYLKKRLLVEPVRKSETAQKEQELVCGLCVRNTGRLPVSRFGLRVSARYGAGQTVRKTPGADDRRPFDNGTEGRYYNTCTPYYSQRGAGLLFPAAGEVRYFEQQDMYIGEGTGKLFRADGMVRRSAGCLCEGGAVRLYPCSGGASSQTAGRCLTDCFRCFVSAGI